MWIIIAILFILSLALYPYVARILARRRMLSRLCADIRRAGGKVRRLCHFPSFSRNRAKKHELLIRAGETQYAVKLWSPVHRDAELRILRDGRVQETRVVAVPLQPHADRRTRTVRGHSYTVPPLKMCFRTPPAFRRVNVLLVYPSYRRILQRGERGWREFGAGESLLGGILVTPADFLALVKQSLGGNNGAIPKENEKNTPFA